MSQMIGLLLCSVIFILGILYKRCGKLKKFPPGPAGIPIFGNLFYVMKLSKKYGGLHRAFRHLGNEYKTPILGLNMGSSLYVVFFTKKYLKVLFSEENFQARPDNFFTRLRTMGERRGITICDGPVFQEQRKFVVRHLSQLGFQRTAMKDNVRQELKHFLAFMHEGADSVHINELLTSAVMNVIWTFIAGRRFSFDDPFLYEWFTLFNERGKLFDVSGGVLAKFPWIRFLAPNKSGYNLILKINAQLKKFIDEEISRHKLKKSEESNDLINLYLQEIENAGSGSEVYNEAQLVAICLDFFIAGMHTTSDTLAFALIAVVKFPEIQTKVQKYLDDVIKLGDIPSYDDKQRLPYIEAVLLESMRYHHTIPFIGPRRVTDDIIVDGFLIPKNTTVMGDLDGYYQSAECWGDPENFRPERFLNKNGEVVSEEKYFFFGRGARSCIGDQLAKQFVFTFFSGILRNFEIALAPGAKIPGEIPGITTKPEPFYVSMKPRTK